MNISIEHYEVTSHSSFSFFLHPQRQQGWPGISDRFRLAQVAVRQPRLPYLNLHRVILRFLLQTLFS